MVAVTALVPVAAGHAAVGLVPVDDMLSDSEGRELLELFRQLRWRGQSDHLHLAGFVVLGPIAGALDLRPQGQITGEIMEILGGVEALKNK